MFKFFQIEQEMALIIRKKDIRSLFKTAWTTLYVPLICKKKAIKDILSKLVEAGISSV